MIAQNICIEIKHIYKFPYKDKKTKFPKESMKGNRKNCNFKLIE